MAAAGRWSLTGIPRASAALSLAGIVTPGKLLPGSGFKRAFLSFALRTEISEPAPDEALRRRFVLHFCHPAARCDAVGLRPMPVGGVSGFSHQTALGKPVSP